MNTVDIVLGIIIVLGIVGGLKKGLLVEVASLIALIAGIYGAIHFSYIAGDYLAEKVSWSENYINLVAFVATFIIIIFAVSFIGKLLTKAVDAVSLGLFNRILGGLFGGLKMVVILGAILVFFHKTNNKLGFIDQASLEESTLYAPVRGVGGLVFDYVIEHKEEYQDEDPAQDI